MEKKNSAMGNVMLVLVTLAGIVLVGFLIFGTPPPAPSDSQSSAKPTPDQILQMLKDGNERFSAGKSAYLHCDPTRIGLAGYIGPREICLGSYLQPQEENLAFRFSLRAWRPGAKTILPF